jgi:poly(A) polymerase
MEEIFSSPPLKRVITALPAGVELYLVGGAVRDALLGRKCYDLDFVLPSGALQFARKLADKLGGAYFPLDQDREYARVVLGLSEAGMEGERIKLDFATYQDDTLESDLRLRDFTINAMALSLHQPHQLVDPLGGAGDLVARRLRACSPRSLINDPLRILRAVRQAIDFDLQITPETTRLMRQAAGQLGQVSMERIRDELFRILAGGNPRLGLEILDRIGALSSVLPEMIAMKGVEQSAPHIYDVWMHTLEVVNKLSAVLAVLSPEYDADTAANLMLGLVSLRLGRYRQALEEHLAEQLNPERSLRALLFFAALYHDCGKPASRQVDEQHRVRFFGHDQEGERLAVNRAQELRMSNLEIERLRLVVRHHMRPFLLGQLEELPTRRAVYRYFRDTGAAGVDICILSLADMLATHGPTLKQVDWAHHLEVIRCLLEAWWEHPREQVSPPGLINGHELMVELEINPGPAIGHLLEAIREAQAVGKVNTREEALELARNMIRSATGSSVNHEG